jgi:hypothetical protein
VTGGAVASVGRKPRHRRARPDRRRHDRPHRARTAGSLNTTAS